MNTIERDLTELFEQDAGRAPDPDAGRIIAAVRTDRRRRGVATIAAAVAGVVAVATPLALHNSSTTSIQRPVKSASPTKAVTPRGQLAPLVSTVVPTFVPAGFRLTDWSGEPLPDHSYLQNSTMTYSNAKTFAFLKVQDANQSAADIPTYGVQEITVAGRRAWLQTSANVRPTVDIYIPWRPHHLITVELSGSTDKTIARQMADSLVNRTNRLTFPIVCGDPHCTGTALLTAGGERGRFRSMAVTYGAIEITVDQSRTMSGTQATHALSYGWYAHIRWANPRSRLSAAQYHAIADSVRLTGRPDFSWLPR